jgi:3-phosphoshikimate 1-carboxyvinyltransferase
MTASSSHGHSSIQATPWRAAPTGALKGDVRVPGDKSMSHRSLLLGALTVGRTSVSGLLESDDVLATAGAVNAMGAQAVDKGDGNWEIDGVGIGGLAEPQQALDFGNAGTGSRLMMGVVAGHPITATFIGDASLSRRPMRRITDPLSLMGATFAGPQGGTLPITVTGAQPPLPITYTLPVASAQVKSAVLLAGLSAPGQTTVLEPVRTRDHTENMLRAFGCDVAVEEGPHGIHAVRVTGECELTPTHVDVPADPSSAAFPLVAALLIEGSDVVARDVMVNPLRAGLFTTLQEMGADITFENERESGGEPVADIRARFSALEGIEVPPDRAASMIDEYPVLAVAAAFATGKTVMRGLEELRVKESDRISATVAMLEACGAQVEELEDGMIVTGIGDAIPGGGHVLTGLDHRIAMSGLVAGLAARSAVTIDDAAMIATSFPAFRDLMVGLGAQITSANR